MLELAKRIEGPLETFNFNTSVEAINTALDVMKKAVDELKSQPFDKVKPESLAKIANYMSKAIDDIARLTSFLSGGPDSRPDLGLDAIFEHLNLEQIQTIEMWLEQSGTWQAMLNQQSSVEKPS